MHIDLLLRPAPAPGHLGEVRAGLVLELVEAPLVHQEGGGALGGGAGGGAAAVDGHRRRGVGDRPAVAGDAAWGARWVGGSRAPVGTQQSRRPSSSLALATASTSTTADAATFPTSFLTLLFNFGPMAILKCETYNFGWRCENGSHHLNSSQSSRVVWDQPQPLNLHHGRPE